MLFSDLKIESRGMRLKVEVIIEGDRDRLQEAIADFLCGCLAEELKKLMDCYFPVAINKEIDEERLLKKPIFTLAETGGFAEWQWEVGELLPKGSKFEVSGNLDLFCPVIDAELPGFYESRSIACGMKIWAKTTVWNE